MTIVNLGYRWCEQTPSDANRAAMWSLSSDLLFNEAKFVHVRFWAKPSFDLGTTTYVYS